MAHRGMLLVGRACGVRFEVKGDVRLLEAGSCVLAPNHSSPLDIPAMLDADPEVRFLAASELFRIPLLASAMRALGTIAIDRHDRTRAYQQLGEVSSSTARLCLTVFPEGGIAPAGTRLPFKNGAFFLAIETGSTIVPVAIHGTAQLLPPVAPWRFARAQ